MYTSMLIHTCTYIHTYTQDHDSIGIDWLGPFSLDDEVSVNVREIPHYLSEEELQIFHSHITLAADELTEESMIHNFAVAKQFVYNAIRQH